jgi:hypothetical protein
MRYAPSLRYPTSSTDALWFDSVQRIAHGQPVSIQHVGIHHGGFHIFMPEEFLDGSDVVALLKELRRDTMSEGMAADAFVEPYRMPSLTHSLLQSALTPVMAADIPREWVFRQTVGRKNIVPDPKSAGMRILMRQRKRSIDRGNLLSHI